MVRFRSKTPIAIVALLAVLALAPAHAHAQDKTASEKRAAEAAKYWVGQSVETLKDGHWTKASVVSVQGEVIRIKMNEWGEKTTLSKSPDEVRVPPNFEVGKTIRWKGDGKVLYGDVVRDSHYNVVVKIGNREEWLDKSTTTFLTPTIVQRPSDATSGADESDPADNTYRPGEPLRFIDSFRSKPTEGIVVTDTGERSIHVQTEGRRYVTYVERKQTLHGPQPLPKTGKDSDIQAINHSTYKKLDLTTQLDNAPSYAPGRVVPSQISNTSPIPLIGPASPAGLAVTAMVRLTEKAGVAIAYETPNQTGPLFQIVDTASHKAGPITPLNQPGTPLAFSPDGSRLATADRGIITVWDISAATPSPIVKFDPFARERYFNPAADSLSFVDNDRVILIGYQHSATILEVRPNSVRSLFGHNFNAAFVYAVSPNGKALALAESGSRGVIVVDTTSGRPVARYNAPDQVLQIEFSPDCNRLSAFSTSALSVWSLTDQRTLFQGAIQSGTTGPAISIDPAYILLSTSKGERALLSTQAGVVIAILNQNGIMAFAPDSGAWVIGNPANGNLQLSYARLVKDTFKPLVSDIMEKNPYVLGPGDRVRLIFDFKGTSDFPPPADIQQRCQAYFEKALTNNGYVLDPNGSVSLTISSLPTDLSRPGNPEYYAHPRSGFVFSVNNPRPDEYASRSGYSYTPAPSVAAVAPLTHAVTFQRVEKSAPLWTAIRNVTYYRSPYPQPGQNQEQMIKDFGARSYQFLLGVTIPRRLPKPLSETTPLNYDPFTEK
jgi:WD40 repeat protein